MFYSDLANYKLHIVKNNDAPLTPGMPKRIILTVNHVERWGTYSDSGFTAYPQTPPNEKQIMRQTDWKIAGDKRAWSVVHVQQLMKPATRVPDAQVTSFLIIVEQVITNPEKDLEVANVMKGSVKHLRRFNNLIMEDE